MDAILDEALVCHLGFVHEEQPFVIPTLHARIDDVVYVHGASASRMIRTLDAGLPACLTVTLLDGIVLARSAFHHSMNYRSVIVLGTARAVDERDEKLLALERFTEHLIPGRWAEVRPPSAKELKATAVLALSLAECSAKLRTGPPGDDEEDYALDAWAGVVPLRLEASPPVPDPRLRPGIEISSSVVRLTDRGPAQIRAGSADAGSGSQRAEPAVQPRIRAGSAGARSGSQPAEPAAQPL